MSKKTVTIATIGGLLLGIGVGAAGNTAPTPTASTPTIVTRTVTPEPSTITKTVEVVPQACNDALDVADKGFALSSESMGYAGQAFNAVAGGDLASLKRFNAEMTRVTGELGDLAPKYQRLKQECHTAS